MSVKCYNCGKPAMYAVGPEGHEAPLCLDCNLKHVQMLAIQNDQIERTINYLTESMESTVGLPGVLPRFPERQVKVIQGGNMTLNNISVSNSAIGVLNTGNLEMVDAAISALKADPSARAVGEAL